MINEIRVCRHMSDTSPCVNLYDWQTELKGVYYDLQPNMNMWALMLAAAMSLLCTT